MNNPLASVVIPAHDEERVIARCLETLLGGSAPGEFEVVVVANGCGDRTADVARRAGVQVIETGAAGKAGALVLGDGACSTFPRLYLDADVQLTTDAARRLVDAMVSTDALACAPAPTFDVSAVNGLARRVQKVHEQLVAPRRALAGTGVYVLSERGHDRVFPLPDVISDDGYVDRSFAPDERLVLSDVHSLVRIAPTFRATLRRRVRLREGTRQLDGLGLQRPAPALRLGDVRGLLKRRAVSGVDVGCYLAMVAAERLLRRARRLRGGQVAWGTDSASRPALTPAAPPPPPP